MKKWLKRIAVTLAVLVVLVVGGGAIYEAVARSDAAKTYPAPGRMVDIGGRRIQLDCRGTGTPIVVFQSGLDSLGSLSWSRVQDEIAKTTRACAYSRAGTMWSDASGRPFSAANTAEDLHKALAAAGEKPPYVMVGHSLGGPYVLSFTGRYGADVAGIVFVDASHPDQLTRLRNAIGKDPDQGGGLADTADSLAWSGLVRLMTAKNPPVPPGAPAQVRDAAAAWFPSSVHSVVQEFHALSATLADAGQYRRLGDRPLVVLTHGVKTPASALAQMKVTADQAARLDAEWLAMQNDEASWSTHSRHTVVTDATHYIQFDDPPVVIAAVVDVVGQVRKGAAK